MRIFLVAALVLSLFYSVDASSQGYKIIIRGEKEGVIDEEGKEVIPPIYDKIGWPESTANSQSTHSDNSLFLGKVTGFREGNKWGLINTRNKVVQPPLYYKLEIFDNDHVIAAVRGSLTNKLFYGLIDKKGEMQISCNYFGIKKRGDFFLVSSYDNNGIKAGLIDSRYELIIPVKYTQIEQIYRGIWAAMTDSYKWHLFDGEGRRLLDTYVDGFELKAERVDVHKEGKVGALHASGKKLYPIAFKEINSSGPVPFPEWRVTDLDLNPLREFQADSLGLMDDLFITYTNGNQEVILNTRELFGEKLFEIRQAKSGFLVVKDLQSEKWSLITTAGKVISQEQDSISFDGVYFFAQDNNQWEVYNKFGRKISIRKFDAVATSVNGLIPVKKDAYWGIMDFQGNPVSTFKYDVVGVGNEKYISVKYLGSWGVINGFGDWVLKPDFDKIIFRAEIIAGLRKGKTQVYDNDAQLLSQLRGEPFGEENFIKIRSGEGFYGMISLEGTVIADPIYDSVVMYGYRYFGYSQENIEMIDSQGKIVMPISYGASDIFGFSEDFYKISKDQKFGFVDKNGKLRIANRYDSAGFFNENRCPVSLNDRWGYIDKVEVLKIQPLFSEAREFNEGHAIVRKGGKYGLINSLGKAVIEPQFSAIEFIPGSGYLLRTTEGKVGMADLQGEIHIRPAYQEIKVVGNDLLITYKSDKAGVMNINGYQKVPFEYDEIEVKGDYLLMKKSSDQ